MSTVAPEPLALVLLDAEAPMAAWIREQRLVALRIYDRRGAIGQADRELHCSLVVVLAAHEPAAHGGVETIVEPYRIVSPFTVVARSALPGSFPRTRGERYYAAELEPVANERVASAVAADAAARAGVLGAAVPYGAPLVVPVMSAARRQAPDTR